ncbi:MAG: hypothetical protein HQK53_05620 [Oligoflexia bacterium]|nr:hypothetical protein [Oligoflexia bacterium]
MKSVELRYVFYLLILFLLNLLRGLVGTVRADDFPNAKVLDSDQVITNLEGKKNLYLPQANVLPHLEINDQMLKNKMEKAKELLGASVSSSGVSANSISINSASAPSTISMAEEENSKRKMVAHKKRIKTISPMLASSNFAPPPIVEVRNSYRDTADGIRIFPQNFHYLQEVSGNLPTISLPSGSTAMGTVLAGIEVSATDSKKTYAKLDYAFLGPNQSVVELKDCMVWFSVNANYTTERIYGDVNTISCRAPNGKTFTVGIKGHLIDREDQYVGAKGELLTRGKITGAALMFLRDATQEFGKAMAAAQIKTDIVDGGTFSSPGKAENVTGSQTKYIAGKSSQAAVGTFLNWWIDFYMGLSPTIAIGPGKKIFLAIEEEVQIPKIFFEETTITMEQVESERKRMNTLGNVKENKDNKEAARKME